MAWLREQRLEAARTMLEHSQGMDAAAAVESIAASCGFGRRRRRGAFRLHKQVFFCTVCEIARREGS
jgi:transcriptional regulator GlxA family with amidase domain